MNKTLLSICPSRGRPDTLKDMLESFAETRSDKSDLIVYLNDDDPKLPEYRTMLAENYFKFAVVVIGPRKFIAEVFNEFSLAHPEYDYYQPFNDDHYFHTYHWDEKLIDIVEEKGKGWGIACADDLLTDWANFKHPSGCVISGNIIRTLGYMIPPGVRHIGIDTVLGKLAQAIDRLWFTRDVIIEHRHWTNGRRKIDDNYKWVYGTEEQNHGKRAVQMYLLTEFKKDVEKLREAMNK